MTTTDVELRGVTKRFDGVVAVDSLDLEVRQGEFLSLLGPSGCGKTTTLQRTASDAQAESLRAGDRVVVSWAEDAALVLD